MNKTHGNKPPPRPENPPAPHAGQNVSTVPSVECAVGTTMNQSVGKTQRRPAPALPTSPGGGSDRQSPLHGRRTPGDGRGDGNTILPLSALGSHGDWNVANPLSASGATLDKNLTKRICLLIRYQLQADKRDQRKKIENIPCTLEDYMKWKLVLLSEEGIGECNKCLGSIIPGMVFTSDREVIVTGFDYTCNQKVQDNIKDMFACVKDMGRDFKIDTLTVSDAKRHAIIMNERSSSSTKQFYVEAINENTICFVSAYSNVNEVKQHFVDLLQLTVRRDEPHQKVEIQMPAAIGKVFRYSGWVKEIEQQHPQVKMIFTGHQTHDMFCLEGPASCVDRARSMVAAYDAKIIRKPFKAREDVHRVLCELSICDGLEEEMKKEKILCFVEQRGKDLILYCASEKDAWRAIPVASKAFSAESDLLIHDWRQEDKKKEFEQLVLKGLDKDRAVFYMGDGARVYVAGFRSEVVKGKRIMDDILKGKYQQQKQNKIHCEKFVVENHHNFMSLQHLVHLEDVCKKWQVRHEPFDFGDVQGFEIKGVRLENVKSAIQEIRQIEKKLINKSICFDTDKEHAYLETADFQKLLEEVEQENQVLIRKQLNPAQQTMSGYNVAGVLEDKNLTKRICLLIRYQLQADKRDQRKKIENIPCTLEDYMKWKLVLLSEEGIGECNKCLGSIIPGMVFTSDREVIVTGFDYTCNQKVQDNIKDMFACVKDMGRDFKIDTLTVSDAKRHAIIMNERSSSSTKQFYVEAINENTICFVSAYSNVNEVKQHFVDLLQLTVRRDESHQKVEIQMPAAIGKVFRYSGWVKEIEQQHPQVKMIFTGHQTHDMFCLEGPASCVDRARSMVAAYDAKIIRKPFKARENVLRVLCELSVCDGLEEEMKKEKILCFVEQRGKDLTLYCASEKDARRAIPVASKAFSAESDLLIQDWRQENKKKEFEQLVLKGLDKDRAVFYMGDGARVYVAGFRSEVVKGKQIMDDILKGKYQQQKQNKIHCEKFVVENHHNFMSLQHLVHLEDVCKKWQVKHEPFDFADIQGFEIKGVLFENVKSAIQEMREIEKKLINKSITFDTDKEHAYLETADFQKLLEEVEQENQVLIRKQLNPAQQMTSGYNVAGVPEGRARTADGEQTWHFHSGHQLTLVHCDFDKCNASVLAKFAGSRPSAKNITITSQGQCMKVTVRIPNWVDGSRGEMKEFEDTIRTVLDKANEESRYNIGLCLTPVANWQFALFVECLAATTTEYYKAAPSSIPPTTVILCAETDDAFEKAAGTIATCTDRLKIKPRQIDVEVRKGELNKTQADVLVNTTSVDLDLKSGKVSAAMATEAGYQMQAECKRKYPKGVRYGEVAVTDGYKLRCQKVFHGALDRYREDKQAKCMIALRSFVSECLSTADQKGYKSIAFPAIGAGNLNYPVKIVASDMFACVERFRLHSNPKSLERVLFVIYHLDKKALECFKEMEKCYYMDKTAAKEVPVSQPATVTVLRMTGLEEDVRRAKDTLKRAVEDAMRKRSGGIGKHVNLSQCVTGVSIEDFKLMKEMYRDVFAAVEQDGVAVTYRDGIINLHGNSDKVSAAFHEVKSNVEQFRGLHKLSVPVTGYEEGKIKKALDELISEYKAVRFVHFQQKCSVVIFGTDSVDIDFAKERLHIKLNWMPSEEKGRKATYAEVSAQIRSPAARPKDRPFSWAHHTKNMRCFQTSSKIAVKVYEADIRNLPVECIVNAANKDLRHFGGIAQNISSAAGSSLDDECRKIIQKGGPLKAGSVVLTTAGKLPYKGVIHAVGPCWDDYKPISQDSLRSCEKALRTAVYNSLVEAHKHNFKTIALPAISSALFAVPKEICATQYAEAVSMFVSTGRRIEEIHFVDKEPTMIGIIHTVFHCMITERKPYPFDTNMYITSPRKQTGRGKSTGKPSWRSHADPDLCRTENEFSEMTISFDTEQECFETDDFQTLVDPLEQENQVHVGKQLNPAQQTASACNVAGVLSGRAGTAGEQQSWHLPYAVSFAMENISVGNGQQQFSPTAALKVDLFMTTSSGLNIHTVEGSIVEMEVDCIVNATNEHLSDTLGMAKAISKAAGSEFKAACKEILSRRTLNAWECVETCPGNLRCQKVLHAVVPVSARGQSGLPRELPQLVIDCLEKADGSGFQSVALPFISAGESGHNLDVCIQQYYTAVSNFDKCRMSVGDVYFVDVKKHKVDKLNKMFKTFLSQEKDTSEQCRQSDREPDQGRRLGEKETMQPVKIPTDFQTKSSPLHGSLMKMTDQGNKMFDAFNNADLKTVMDLIKKNRSLVDHQMESRTILHLACHEGYMDLITFLVDSGADVNKRDDEGDAPLHYAAFGERPDCVQEMLRSAADVNAQNKSGITPLIIAINHPCIDSVRCLILNNADVNIKKTDGNTAMHDAVEQKDGQPDISKAVLSANMADFSVINSKHFNILHLAAIKDNKAAVRMILEKSTNIVDIPVDRITALHMAATNDFVEVTSILLDLGGADPNLKDAEGRTALHLAVAQANKRVIEVLVEKQADVNAQDNHGDTPLHYSQRKSDSSASRRKVSGNSDVNILIVYSLLEKGANLYKPNKIGKTPMDLVEDVTIKTMLQKLTAAYNSAPVRSQRGIRLPIHWQNTGADVMVVPLDKSVAAQKQEFEEVEKQFQKSMPDTDLDSVKRVENPLLWEHYMLKKREMERKYGQGCANESHLYHGTKPEFVDTIAEENFDFRIAGTSAGALYGNGSYFATTAKYSDLYAIVDSQGYKVMFVAKVLTGKVCAGKPGLTRPPAVDPNDKKKGKYDCTVNNVLSPTIFCVFDHNQYYPEYIVEYQ